MASVDPQATSAREGLVEPASIRDSGLFVVLMAAGSAIALIKGLVYAKVLAPDELGYYGLVAIVGQFGVFVCNWGILNALNNHLPIAFGRGHTDDRDLLERSLGAILVSTAITSLLYLFVVLALSFNDAGVKTALLLAAGATAIATVIEFHILVLRVRHQVVPMGVTIFSRALAMIVLGTAGAALFGYRGLIVAEMIAILAAIAISRGFWLGHLGAAMPSRKRVWDLVRAGSPLMASNVLIAATLTGDRLFVAAALPDDFGQYVFAAFVVLAWISVLGVMSQVIAPRLLHNYGVGLRLRDLRRESLRVVGLVLLAGIAGLGLLMVTKEPLADGFLSEYAAGLDVMPILYIGGLILVSTFPGFVLGAVRPTHSTLAAALATAVTLIGGLILSGGDPELSDFAWLFVASQASALVLISLAVEIQVRRDPDSPDLFSAPGG